MAEFFKQCLDITRWTKSTITIIHIALVCTALAVPVFLWHNGYSNGYKKATTVVTTKKDLEFKQWIADHPQQTISGSTVNNNVNKPNNHFRMSVMPFTVGWCE